LGGRTTSASAGLILVQSRVPGPALDFARANVELLAQYREELGGDIDYVRCGSLVLAEDETERALLREFVRRQSAHLPVEFLEAEDVARLEPNLAPGYLAASYCALDGYANPMGVSIAFARGARALGAELRLRTEVTGIQRTGARVTGVLTTSGPIAAGAVVDAAGVWSPEVARMAGVDVPVVPRKGQLLVSEPIPAVFRNVLNHAGLIPFKEHGITFAEIAGELAKKRYMKQAVGGPYAGRVYIGSTSEFVGFDRTNTWKALTELARYAVETVPALGRARLVRAWAGLRPRTADGRFLIGPAPALEGFWMATGHDSNGVLHCSATGHLLSEWMATGRRPPLLAPFDPARLAREPVASARA
ncbi:MAG: FAD-binding oxidoreductase, partial [Candidatus Rokubacteria bacterium]|nr:FAD-binding oxidoreductase [Candidatus Rokubacteria bacterium]